MRTQPERRAQLNEKESSPVNAALWACSNTAENRSHFPKISPGEFLKTIAMQRGGPFRRDPLYPLNEFEAVIRSRWVEFAP